MSRHRLVRNMNLQDELDDDALSDGGDDLTDEQYAQMESGLAHVRALIGDEATSGFNDTIIKDALWEYFFDVEKTLSWLYDEQERRIAAKERKVPTNGQDGSHQYDSHYSAGQTGVYPEDIERPRVPLIVLAQQGHYQPDYYPQEYVEYVPEMDFDDAPMGIMSRASRLSTITELTERTEPSRHRPSGQYLTNGARGSLSTDTTSSYGQVINRRSAGSSNMFSPTPPLDPNDIPPSPSPSAIQRLSIHDSAPSALSTDTGSEVNSDNTVSPRAPSVSVPPVDTIPDIPDSLSRVSDAPPPPPEKDFQPRTHPPKRSKLATLASSRASTISSSRSSDLETTSILTYPALRPSAESRFSYGSRATSAMAPSEVSEKSDRTARGNPTASEKSSSSVKPPSTTPSSMSSHVRRAIRTAMELEAHDHESTPKARGKDLSETSSISTIKPAEPSPVVPNRTLDSLVMHGEPDTKSRPQSKLAKLAQAKANASVPLIPKSLPPTSPLPLPKPHTEYLTPIANGATATTAITTSYQSLHSLSVSHAPPPLPLVQMPTIESRQSKLAMKVKKGQSKPSSHSSTTDEEWNIPSPSPLFLSKSSRSLKDKHSKPPRYGREELKLIDVYQASCSQSKSTLDLTPNGQSKHSRTKPNSPDMSVRSAFAFDVPSPDDTIFNARRAAKEREKAQKAAQQKKGTSSSGYTTPVSRVMSPDVSPVKSSRKVGGMTQPSKKTGDGILSRTSSGGFDQRLLDIAALNLTSKEEPARIDEPPPRMTLEREKLLEEARRFIESSGQKDKKSVSLVVIGHVDAGKSTLMGRLLYELGRIDEKTRVTNERGSSKVGKSSFSWAWGLDGTTEERERGITMDIALQSLTTPHRQVTILDAPGHKDFIPNMISGASQADCALLVVDAATGEFEAGFDRGGQTREHILLVRSLGVSQLIVAVNKLDQVNWSQARYEDICGLLRSFLGQSGFHPSKMGFVPVGAMLGVNLVDRNSSEASELSRWYQGPTLVDLLDELEPPTRDIESPLRIPISNVFKGQSSGTGISGRICGGVVQVGERVRVLPGDETAIIRSINIDENSVSWAAAGSNVTLYLTSIDPIHLNIGSVLCSPGNLVPLATVFSARIIVFDIQVPITSGASIELFHHSRDVPAMISKLVSSLDRASGTVVKKGPRVLSKSMSAEVQITLRGGTLSAPSAVARPIPLEPFSMNKDMGRILVRRGGETIAAGIVLDIIG